MSSQTISNKGQSANNGKNTLSKPQMDRLISGIIKGLSANQRKTPVPKKVLHPHENEPGLKEAYKEYYDDSLADYIYGLYHPDAVYTNHLDIKYPAPMPVPTTSFCFKDTFTVVPNARGNFAMVWSPGFLGTQDTIEQEIGQQWIVQQPRGQFATCYVNEDAGLDGNSPLYTGWVAHAGKQVAQDFSKYRLTSACIKVKYTGKVLDQSGMLAACATYMTIPTYTYLTEVGQPTSQNIINQYVNNALGSAGDFDTIRQGQWAHTVSLVSEPDGLTCVWLPTDPLSHVFVNNGHTIDVDQVYYNGQQDGQVYRAWTAKNAALSYLICGYGIGSNTSCITVEIYSNFEIIVTPEQMPYFRPTQLNANLIKHTDKVVSVMRGVSASAGGITATKHHDEPSTMSRVKSAIRSAARTAFDYAPALLKMATMLI